MSVTERLTPTLFTKLEDGRWKLTRTWERYCYGTVNSDPTQNATVPGLNRVLIHAITSSTFYRNATEEEKRCEVSPQSLDASVSEGGVVTTNLLNPEDFTICSLWLVREEEQPLERELPKVEDV